MLGAVRFGAVLHVRKEAYNEACLDAASLQEVGNGPARNNLYALAILLCGLMTKPLREVPVLPTCDSLVDRWETSHRLTTMPGAWMAESC